MCCSPSSSNFGLKIQPHRHNPPPDLCQADIKHRLHSLKSCHIVRTRRIGHAAVASRFHTAPPVQTIINKQRRPSKSPVGPTPPDDSESQYSKKWGQMPKTWKYSLNLVFLHYYFFKCHKTVLEEEMKRRLYEGGQQGESRNQKTQSVAGDCRLPVVSNT